MLSLEGLGHRLVGHLAGTVSNHSMGNTVSNDTVGKAMSNQAMSTNQAVSSNQAVSGEDLGGSGCGGHQGGESDESLKESQ